MTIKLCFAAFIRVLKECSRPKTKNKELCGAVLKTLDVGYGEYLSADDSAVSRLLSCNDNLSTANVVDVAKKANRDMVAQAMNQYVLPIIDSERLPLAMLALQDMVLKNVEQDDTSIGGMKRHELALMVEFVPEYFLADVFLYVAGNTLNKAGKDTIKQVCASYIKGFEPYRDNVRILLTRTVEQQELSRTLELDEFEAVFREVQHGERLACKNSSDVRLFCLDMVDSQFNYNALSDYLFDSVGMYVFSRTQLKEFEDKRKVRSIGARALRLMKENGAPGAKGTGNALGEMLLFAFMENGLCAPKLLSKVEISTTAAKYHSKSDAVHLLKRSVNGITAYQLVFGAASINSDINTAINAAFDTITEIKKGRTKERQMIDGSLFNNTFDNETTEHLRQILVPSKNQQSAPDMAFGIFVGYSLGISCDDNDAFRVMAMDKMMTDIKAAAPHIMEKINGAGLGMHSFYFFFLPLNDADNDNQQIMDELMIGGTL